MLIGLSLFALVVGAVACGRASGRSRADRLALCVLPPALCVAVFLALDICLASVWYHWNGSRLAPALALLKGVPLYCGPEQGPIQSTMYPPGSYLAYLPAALGSTPVAALFIASLLTIVYVCLAPALAFARTAGRRGLPVIAATLALFLASDLVEPLQHYMSKVHVDGPAMMFAMLACLAVTRFRPGHDRPLWLAALGVCLSLWCKQTMVPVVIVLPLFLGWLHGGRTALRFTGMLAAVGLLSAPAALLFAPWDVLVFQLLDMPSRYGFKEGGLAGALAEFGAFAWPSLLAFALVAGLRLATSRGRGLPALKAWATADPGFLLLVTAVLLTPVSLLGQWKFGGYANSYHNLYFLQVATLCLLIGSREIVLHVAVLLLTATVAIRLSGVSFGDELDALERCSDQVAYEFALAHPGELWFPWNPLATVMAEGRLDHQDRAVYDWTQAGQAVTTERLLSGIPPSVERMAYPTDVRRGNHRTITWLMNGREYKAARLDELPKFRVFPVRR